MSSETPQGSRDDLGEGHGGRDGPLRRDSFRVRQARSVLPACTCECGQLLVVGCSLSCTRVRTRSAQPSLPHGTAREFCLSESACCKQAQFRARHSHLHVVPPHPNPLNVCHHTPPPPCLPPHPAPSLALPTSLQERSALPHSWCYARPSCSFHKGVPGTIFQSKHFSCVWWSGLGFRRAGLFVWRTQAA